LRALGSDAQLGVDLVQYPKEIEPAVLYAMGNSMVASTLDKAKRLNREGGHKVTDLDGTLISVNGSMSGGATRSVSILYASSSCMHSVFQSGLELELDTYARVRHYFHANFSAVCEVNA
jgi:chromosome segregation ATPase